jgi:hypothetical protein
MMVTYRELLNQLNKLDDEQLDDNITLHLLGCNEIFGDVDFYVTDTNEDRLDKGHLVLTFNNS